MKLRNQILSLAFVAVVAATGAKSAQADDQLEYSGKLDVQASLNQQKLTDQCAVQIAIHATANSVEFDRNLLKCTHFNQALDLEFDLSGTALTYQGKAIGTYDANGSLEIDLTIANEEMKISVTKLGAYQMNYTESEIITDQIGDRASSPAASTLAVSQSEGSLSLTR
jgi:hypothetical protein